jgi:YegS/Rv2252/BmrU family lipid kinase
LLAIIINPISGGAHGSARASRVELARAVVERRKLDAAIHVTERPNHARQLAQAAVTSGARRIVAWGGDGTINEVASAVAFTNVAMGIVPGGSGNGLARELALPFDAHSALERALGGNPHAIDVGEIEQRLFVNVAGIGLDAHVAARFNAEGNLRRGPRTYVAMTAAALIGYRAKTYDIITGGERMTKTALMIVLANGTEFGNRILIARGARVDDGLLDVVVVEERSRMATISRVPWLLARSIHRVPMWSTRPVIEVTVESSEPILFHVDGEPVQGGRSLSARVHPGALNVVS